MNIDFKSKDKLKMADEYYFYMLIILFIIKVHVLARVPATKTLEERLGHALGYA